MKPHDGTFQLHPDRLSFPLPLSFVERKSGRKWSAHHHVLKSYISPSIWENDAVASLNRDFMLRINHARMSVFARLRVVCAFVCEHLFISLMWLFNWDGREREGRRLKMDARYWRTSREEIPLHGRVIWCPANASRKETLYSQMKRRSFQRHRSFKWFNSDTDLGHWHKGYYNLCPCSCSHEGWRNETSPPELTWQFDG